MWLGPGLPVDATAFTAEPERQPAPVQLWSCTAASCNPRVHAGGLAQWHLLTRSSVSQAGPCQGVLHRQPVQARQILRKLVVGRLVFTPLADAEGRYYEFAGQGALDKLLAGIIRPSSVVTPGGSAAWCGFELSGEAVA